MAATTARSPGVGFQPDWVFTLGDGEESVQRPGTQVGDGAHFVWGGDFRLDKIQAMEADGFQLGSHSDTNASGVTFHYVAWNASGNVTQASYVGNGNDNRSITGVGFSPDMLWVKRNSNNPSAWRPTALSGDAVLFFGSNNQPPADRIQAIEPDGFQIGTHEQVNASGSTYHYMAING